MRRGKYSPFLSPKYVQQKDVVLPQVDSSLKFRIRNQKPMIRNPGEITPNRFTGRKRIFPLRSHIFSYFHKHLQVREDRAIPRDRRMRLKWLSMPLIFFRIMEKAAQLVSLLSEDLKMVYCNFWQHTYICGGLTIL